MHVHDIAEACNTALDECAEAWRYAWRLYGPAVALAVVGGVVQWLQDRRRGRRWYVATWDLFASCLISGFVGLVTAHALTALHVGFDWTVAGAAISGHMGTRALYLIQRYITTWVDVQTRRLEAAVPQPARAEAESDD